jgi:hypothetical protein
MTNDEVVAFGRQLLESLVAAKLMLGGFIGGELVAISGLEKFSPQEAIDKWDALQANPPPTTEERLACLQLFHRLIARAQATYAQHALRHDPVPRIFHRTMTAVLPEIRSKDVVLAMAVAVTLYSWSRFGCEEIFYETVNPKTHPVDVKPSYYDIVPLREEYPLRSGKYPLAPLRFAARFPGADSSLLLSADFLPNVLGANEKIAEMFAMLPISKL